jgi:hypothetical protein
MRIEIERICTGGGRGEGEGGIRGRFPPSRRQLEGMSNDAKLSRKRRSEIGSSGEVIVKTQTGLEIEPLEPSSIEALEKRPDIRCGRLSEGSGRECG